MQKELACMKYILFGFNFLLWTLGAGLLGIGIWVLTDNVLVAYKPDVDISHYYNACYLIVTVGVVLLIIGFLGCCGAAMESPCMLLAYFICMVILLILELAAAGLVWKIASGDTLQKVLSKEIMWHIEQTQRPSDPHARFLNLLQLNLQCCGAYTYLDYDKMSKDTPPSCNNERTNNINVRSCGENLRRYVEKRGAAIGGVSLGVALLQLMSLVFALCMFCALRQEEKDTV